MNIKKITQAYKDVKDSVLLEMINKETMNTIRQGMEKYLPEYKIKCDYENNPPEAIDSGKVMVRVSDPITMNYINLIF